ncbi:MAG TPA: sigma 54-interacting transcriptional regulator [Silvibacterium sp.]|nr:sigma 54-interacting transcriptional regulator [Silvibacterium sp.]
MEVAHPIEDALQPVAVLHPEHDRNERDRFTFGQMVGRSPAMQRLFSQMRHTARHLRIANIVGEPGTGKLLAARTLHDFSLGPQQPFIPCPAVEICSAAEIAEKVALQTVSQRPLGLPGSTRESVFSKLPAIGRSCGGTLVLTRIDELSSVHQERILELLRWVDHQHLLRSLESIPHHILCLSSQPLRNLAATNRLRSDLAARLTAIRFALPPLRERREDIPLLAETLAQRFSANHGKPVRGLDPQTLHRLVQHSWPGNVRELESIIRAAALDCPGQWIRPIDLPAFAPAPALRRDFSGDGSNLEASSAPDHEPNFDPNLDRTILRHIQRVLARAQGNKFRAAKMLGISRSTLYRLLDSTSIPDPS